MPWVLMADHFLRKSLYRILTVFHNDEDEDVLNKLYFGNKILEIIKFRYETEAISNLFIPSEFFILWENSDARILITLNIRRKSNVNNTSKD